MQDYLKAIGITLSFLRKNQKLTQKDFSQKIDITYRYYQDIEKGKVNITFATLYKFVQFYDYNIEEFLELSFLVSNYEIKNKRLFEGIYELKKLAYKHYLLTNQHFVYQLLFQYQYILENYNLRMIEKIKVKGATLNIHHCIDWVTPYMEEYFGFTVGQYCRDLILDIDKRQEFTTMLNSILNREKNVFYAENFIKDGCNNKRWVGEFFFYYKGKIFSFCEDITVLKKMHGEIKNIENEFNLPIIKQKFEWPHKELPL